MRISNKKLLKEAGKVSFRPDVLEKVAHLLNLLETIQSHPFLKGKLALKGGTALNLFIFDVPRLSVDIDLNYLGAADKEIAFQERPDLEKALQAVFSREGFNIQRMPSEHAGGKWLLQYSSATGQMGNLEVDVNFMFRVPLWPIVQRNSKPVGSWQANSIPVLDIHEIAAGKLAALLSRKQARDLFDCHNIFRMNALNTEQLRLAFVLYGAMNRKDWRTVTREDVHFDPDELARQLIPTLRTTHPKQQNSYAQTLVKECQQGLSSLLPFEEHEMKFLNLLLDEGKIEAELLTTDTDLKERILQHPLLLWKAQNVRKHRNLD